MGSAGKGVRKPRTLYRNRGFLGYVAMSVSSRTASSVFGIAVVWVVFEVTRSVIDVGIVGLAQSLTTIAFTLPGGVWVDRYSRSGLLALSNLVRAASLGVVAAVIALYGFQFSVVVAAAVAWSGATELYRSSSYSYLPELVEPGELSDANGVTRASTSVVASASNAMGGGIIAFAGTVVAFAYGAVGFAAAAVFALLLTARSVPAQAKSLARAGMLSEVRAGLGWLRSQRGLLYLSISATVFNFFGGAVYYYLVVYMVQGVGLGAFAFGVAVGANVLGVALGSLALGRTRGLSRAGVAWVLGAGSVPGALYLLMGLEPLVVIAVAALFWIGFAEGFGGNAWLTAAQNIVPKDMRGRYFAIDGFFSFIGGPPAIVAGSLLIAFVGILPAYTYIGGALLFASLVFAAMRDLWKLDGRARAA
ncbi:MAG: MFS transporter [Nitrososphaerota archaeon]|nr:MFS transporter [Nitrososphaerota archaeon]MCL5672857.1 MFS transporter [Nitrososphaerota archaeon]MDG6912959.1 MFS transporter [Nitrososphaerota archaeon]MDG6937354.1 MFS transporter [Nitrososphaerota archaeon]MDG6961733.1 MFS transporter [Nitrososphaerota archaeon]